MTADTDPKTPGGSAPTKLRQGAELPAPAGIHPMGQLDARYPVAYEASAPAALGVAVAWMAALARRDAAAMAAPLHFPFAIFEGTEPLVVESAAAFAETPPASLNVTGRGATEIAPGSYDLLDKLELLIFCPVAAGLSLSFTRYSKDGHKLCQCDGVYAVTNNDGRWGIELASTIYTPAAEIGQVYSDAVEANLRRGRDWMLGYTLRSQALLNSTRRPGRNANITIYGPRERAGAARAGNPMAGYVSQGVKSRLRVSEATQEGIDRADANFPEFARWAGGAVGEWDYTMNHPDARVLHASPNKAHTLSGYIRYTKDHVEISETRSLGVSVYRNNQWAPAGGLGNVMLHHDRSNSVGR
ncbi:MAG TPA: hypothetical protein VGG29_14990 [Caulobacteraceae bacterium]|jgi:hypothetical protein